MSPTSGGFDHFSLSDIRDSSSAKDKVPERSKFDEEDNVALLMLFELMLIRAGTSFFVVCWMTAQKGDNFSRLYRSVSDRKADRSVSDRPPTITPSHLNIPSHSFCHEIIPFVIPFHPIPFVMKLFI